MPANSRLEGTPATEVSAGPAEGAPSLAERLGAERTERRHQRTLARESSTPARQPERAERHTPAAGSSSRLSSPAHRRLRGAVTGTQIAAVAAGGVLGAILGVVSIAGWVIGLLAAALAVVLMTAIRR